LNTHLLTIAQLPVSFVLKAGDGVDCGLTVGVELGICVIPALSCLEERLERDWRFAPHQPTPAALASSRNTSKIFPTSANNRLLG